jgi:hypothetical protein
MVVRAVRDVHTLAADLVHALAAPPRATQHFCDEPFVLCAREPGRYFEQGYRRGGSDEERLGVRGEEVCGVVFRIDGDDAQVVLVRFTRKLLRECGLSCAAASDDHDVTGDDGTRE